MKAFPIVLFLAVVATSEGGPDLSTLDQTLLTPGGDGNLCPINSTEKIIKRICTEKDVFFHLYTRINPNSSQIMRINDTSSMGYFDVRKPFKFIVHGWMNSRRDMEPLKDAILHLLDCNVVVVDWCSCSCNLIYSVVVKHTVFVGTYMAKFLDYLADEGVPYDSMDLIGHSLGAHVCGMAGQAASGIVSNITALDPAKPLFENRNDEERVDRTDAKCVQVFHTNGRYLGIEEPIGHIDFYPNGGIIQAGCYKVGCSHGRCLQYLEEAYLSSTPFTSTRCSSWDSYKNGECNGNPTINMGEEQNCTQTTGTFFLYTNDKSPFARGNSTP